MKSKLPGPTRQERLNPIKYLIKYKRQLQRIIADDFFRETRLEKLIRERLSRGK